MTGDRSKSQQNLLGEDASQAERHPVAVHHAEMAELLRETEEEPVGDFVALHAPQRVVLWDGEKVNARAGHDYSHSTFSSDISSSVEFSSDDVTPGEMAFADDDSSSDSSGDSNDDSNDDSAGDGSSNTASEASAGESGEFGDTAEMPASFSPIFTPHHTRVAFSHAYHLLTHQHVEDSQHEVRPRTRRRTMQDESLHLIDDLINRPVDPLFEDAMLYRRAEKPFVRWSMRVIAFFLCVVIGIVCVIAVQSLHGNTREKVRQEEANQLAGLVKRSTELQTEVQQLRKQIDDLSSGSSEAVKAPSTDGIANGTSVIEGPGITVTIADPALPDDSVDGATGARVSGTSGRKVTDTDIQLFVDRLWAMGAEGISVNDERLGPETSIRSAGGKILIGVTAIQSPYTIQAIGDADSLVQGVDEEHNPKLYESIQDLGISISVSRSDKLTLNANAITTLEYATEHDDGD